MRSQILASPNIAPATPDLVNHYVRTFDAGNAEGRPDLTVKAVARLVEAFPHNHNLEHVLLKVAAINSLYSTKIYALPPVAENIVRLQIDAELERGELDLVNKIAIVKVGAKTRRNYSFATKYCSCHKPECYPIYDSLVAQLLCEYQKKDGFAGATDLKMEELRLYPGYRNVVDKFMAYYKLDTIGYMNVDKFLWLYGKEMFPRKPSGDAAKV